jgi:hypothetical protein
MVSDITQADLPRPKTDACVMPANGHRADTLAKWAGPEESQ